jgi:hypothetical protein
MFDLIWCVPLLAFFAWVFYELFYDLISTLRAQNRRS